MCNDADINAGIRTATGEHGSVDLVFHSMYRN